MSNTTRSKRPFSNAANMAAPSSAAEMRKLFAVRKRARLALICLSSGAQQLTVVARPWRARSLAKALKTAPPRQAHESHPEARIMRTGNGETNAVMRSIDARA